MAIVERGNVQLTIDDDVIDLYLAKGYNVVDGKGGIIKECLPNDIKTLQHAYIENKKTIKSLQNEIADLRARLSGDNNVIKGKTIAQEEENEVTEEQSNDEKPKKSRGRAKTNE